MATLRTCLIMALGLIPTIAVTIMILYTDGDAGWIVALIAINAVAFGVIVIEGYREFSEKLRKLR